LLEKDIENLIAKYPDEFFPNSKFILDGQQVRLGTCYADIIFTDQYGRKIIIEVKRGILNREASGQVIEYYGLLKQRDPEAIIELILCANTIPPERRSFLERAGIECKELGISTIQKIAEKCGYRFLDEPEKQPDNITLPAPAWKTGSKETLDSPGNIWIFQANPTRYDILNALSDQEIQQYYWTINQHKREIKKGDLALIWMSGKEAGIYAVASIESDPTVTREPTAEGKYWANEGDRNISRLRAKVANIVVLLNHPILRQELKSVEALKNLSIFKVAQGTNFPVTSDEWKVIKNLIDQKGQSAA
jgi:predicted RNA-binding protein with PUA-like domain